MSQREGRRSFKLWDALLGLFDQLLLGLDVAQQLVQLLVYETEHRAYQQRWVAP